MKIYCDTCILIYLFERKQSKYIDYHEESWKLFNKFIEGEHTLVISDHVFYEFEKVKGNVEQLEKVLAEIISNYVIKINTDKQDKNEARKLSLTNFPDALHMVLTKKSGSQYITTRDKHYSEFFEYAQNNGFIITVPERI